MPTTLPRICVPVTARELAALKRRAIGDGITLAALLRRGVGLRPLRVGGNRSKRGRVR